MTKWRAWERSHLYRGEKVWSTNSIAGLNHYKLLTHSLIADIFCKVSEMVTVVKINFVAFVNYENLIDENRLCRKSCSKIEAGSNTSIVAVRSHKCHIFLHITQSQVQWEFFIYPYILKFGAHLNDGCENPLVYFLFEWGKKQKFF